MNFMQWLNSLDDLLYEVMSWLIFFPVTLWRVVTRPLGMMDYANLEVHEKAEEQFTDTISPPLFLVIALLLSHGIELVLGGGTNPIVARNDGLASLVNDNTTLLMLRLVVFSVFPLMLAVRLLRAKSVVLTRSRLRAPFYAQCYAAAPFALLVGMGTSIAHTHHVWSLPAGSMIAIMSVTGYAGVQAAWFARHLDISVANALLHTVRGLVTGAVLAFIIALLFTGGV